MTRVETLKVGDSVTIGVDSYAVVANSGAYVTLRDRDGIETMMGHDYVRRVGMRVRIKSVGNTYTSDIVA